MTIEAIHIESGKQVKITFINRTPYGRQFYLNEKKNDVWIMPDHLIKKYFTKMQNPQR
jgi:hypothetical protein